MTDRLDQIELLEVLKRRAESVVDDLADELISISHAIHAQPEERFKEHEAHRLLTETLVGHGFDTTRSAFGQPTGFVATAGADGPLITVCCEYDALPGIGHACGHNIIAAAGLGAGLAASAVADEAGGRVMIWGTPAEEGGGGKQLMIDEGALSGVAAAVMVHPAGVDLRSMGTLAVQRLIVTYHGKAAHSAAFPERGRNALDAMVLGYMNVAALRQHINPDERVHGIFLEAGEAPNVVPARTQAEWYVRSRDRAGLADISTKVEACLSAGAAAAGCELELAWSHPAYDNLRSNSVLEDLYVVNAARTGRLVISAAEAGEAAVVGSTDMGNVSYYVPSIHPMIAVADPDVMIHTEAFASFAAAPSGDLAVLDAAKAMACTVIDLWLSPGSLAAAHSEFNSL